VVKNIAEALQYSGASERHSTDKKKSASTAPIPATKSLVLFDSIKDRESDTRQLNLKHVEALAESIAVLGLIEPLVTDKNYVLLAGGHRKAAIAFLRETNGNAYETHFGKGIPVRVMDFDAAIEPERALEIEIAENEQRRDYTPAEVRAIADRLKNAGYFAGKGRPPKGKPTVKASVAAIIGKSEKTVQRYLNAEDTDQAEKGGQMSSLNSERHLDRAIAALRAYERDTGNDVGKAVKVIEKLKLL